MDDFLFSSVFTVVTRVLIFMGFTLMVIHILCDKENTSYTDYEINGCRYFVTQSKGLFSRNSCERLDVFYNDTKYTIKVSRIKIGTESFVRVYDDCASTIEVYMTQNDYMLYIDSWEEMVE